MAKTSHVKATQKRKNTILLGAIADDIAGATDLYHIYSAGACARFRKCACPLKIIRLHDANVVVISLATRTGPAKSAMRQSAAAPRWLQGRSAKQFSPIPLDLLANQPR